MTGVRPSSPPGRALALARVVLGRCDALAGCTEEPGVITRPFPSQAMTRAQDMVCGWMAEAGLDPQIDPIGNVIGRRRASHPDAPVLLIGSHLDSVRNAGRYDGVLGVLAAIATVEAVADADLPFRIDVIAFCDEEGLRFGSTFFGSLAVAGSLGEVHLGVTDADGITLAEALADAGYAPHRTADAAYDPARTLGYLELHIEQGPRLERERVPLGVVPAIAGQTKASVAFNGRAAHAGTTPMDARRDALAGAAEWALAVERHARNAAGLVATVGRIQAEPGAVNVVAGRATCTLDVRHEADAVRIAAVEALRSTAEDIARERGLRIEWDVLVDDATAPLDEELATLLERLTGAPRVVSGAGHDAAVLARFTRAALLFVRCPGGVSHHPDEAVAEKDVAVALDAMAGFVRALADPRAAAGA